VRTGISVNCTAGFGARRVAKILPGGLGKLHSTRMRPLLWRTGRHNARPLAKNGVGVIVAVPAAAICRPVRAADATPATKTWLLNHSAISNPASTAFLQRIALRLRIHFDIAALF